MSGHKAYLDEEVTVANKPEGVTMRPYAEMQRILVHNGALD
jgi:hypothetical protein